MTSYDILIAGGGPAGSSAAWAAARAGAKVLVCDKALFPRDKPCGDGLTPRSVRLLHEMGLGRALEQFHRVDSLRVHSSRRVVEADWPVRDNFPRFGYVAPRDVFDTLLLENAEKAGATVMMDTSVIGPLVDRGVVSGFRTRTKTTESEVRAQTVIAADGSSSALCRAVGMNVRPDRPVAVAIRAQVPARRSQDRVLEAYFTLRKGWGLRSGYGWLFPMGDGRINVGVGLTLNGNGVRSVNLRTLMQEFVATLPNELGLPPIQTMQREGCLKAWRLPMGLAVWPPWRPGIMAVGDAAGVIKPFSGAGISKAIESGQLAATTALEALDGSGTHDLSPYAHQLQEKWGAHYRAGRWMVQLGQHPWALRSMIGAGMLLPPVASFLAKLVSNVQQDVGGEVTDAAVRALLRLAAWRDAESVDEERKVTSIA